MKYKSGFECTRPTDPPEEYVAEGLEFRWNSTTDPAAFSEVSLKEFLHYSMEIRYGIPAEFQWNTTAMEYLLAWNYHDAYPQAVILFHILLQIISDLLYASAHHPPGHISDLIHSYMTVNEVNRLFIPAMQGCVESCGRPYLSRPYTLAMQTCVYIHQELSHHALRQYCIHSPDCITTNIFDQLKSTKLQKLPTSKPIKWHGWIEGKLLQTDVCRKYTVDYTV